MIPVRKQSSGNSHPTWRATAPVSTPAMEFVKTGKEKE